jgi:hypothetical protein
MKKDDRLYGMSFTERLADEPEELVFEMMEGGETFEDFANDIEWPLTIYVFKRREIAPKRQQRIADRVVESTLPRPLRGRGITAAAPNL